MPYAAETYQRRMAPRSYTTPSGSYLAKPTGGGGTGSGGGGGGKNNSGPPGIKDYLGMDVDYQNAVNDLQANFGAYRTENVTQRGNLKDDYRDTFSRLTRERNKSWGDMRNDFAARGILTSGLYGKENTERAQGFADQFGDARTSRDRNLSQLLIDLANARRLRNQQLQDAKLAAIRRRAAEYGITG